MAWLRVAFGATSRESQEGSQEPRLGLGGRGLSCPLACSPLICLMGFWPKSFRGIQQLPPLHI